MGFWVSLHFNHEQVKKGVKGFHMLVVSLSSFLWNVGYMHDAPPNSLVDSITSLNVKAMKG